MALQELSPMPAITGYQQLGNTILGATASYAQDQDEKRKLADARARQDALLGIQRQQQLSDVASQRQYQDDREARLHKQALIDAYKNEGVWDPSIPNEDDAMKAAYLEAQARGLDKLYGELTQTADPGTGKPLLDRNDMGDRSRVAEAKEKLAALKAARGLQAQTDVEAAAARARSLPGRIDADANRVAAQLEQAQQQESDVLNQLQSITQVINSGGQPTPAEIMQEAVRKATELKVAENQKRWGVTRAVIGEHATPSQADIQAAVPAVIEDLRARKLDSALASQEGLRRQLEGARAIRLSLVNQQDTLRRQGGYPTGGAPAGSGLLTPAPASTPPLSMPAGNPTSGFLQQIKGASAAAPSPAANSFQGLPASQVAAMLNPPVLAPASGPSLAAMGGPTQIERVKQSIRDQIRGIEAFPQDESAMANVAKLKANLSSLEQQYPSPGSPPVLQPDSIPVLQPDRTPARSPLLMNPAPAAPGRPITPSASIFPTAPWWSSAA